eukprot:14336085-Heterocapsa_arctica.AAC.1
MKYKLVEHLNTVWDAEEKHRQNTSLRQTKYSGEDNTVNQQRYWRDIQEEIITSYLMDGGHVVDVTQKDRA